MQDSTPCVEQDSSIAEGKDMTDTPQPKDQEDVLHWMLCCCWRPDPIAGKADIWNHGSHHCQLQVQGCHENDLLPETAGIFTTIPDVFDDGKGSLPGIAHFELDPTVKPVTSPAGWVPIAMKSRVNVELNRLTERNVITPVD